MSAVDRVIPNFVPKPVDIGTFASNPDMHFYLMEFVDMTNEVPGPDLLTPKVVEMHQKCLSPTGKFGFHVPNMGALVQPNGWFASWEEFFTQIMQHCFDFEQGMHGRNDEMQQLFEQVKAKVIPRLLRPLETGGNEIAPRLLHADLWDGNASSLMEARSMVTTNVCSSSFKLSKALT